MSSKIENIEIEIEKINNKIKKYEREMKSLISKEEMEKNREARKKRASILIYFGSIFETIGLLNENYDVLLGYLSRYYKIPESTKPYLEMLGQEIRAKKKRNSEKINEQEILFLIDKAKKNNIDLFTLYLQIYGRRKKTLSTITKREFEELKKSL